MNLRVPQFPFLLAFSFVALFGINLVAGINRTGGLALALTLTELAAVWLSVNRPRLALPHLLLLIVRR